ncbi:thioredoxin domain-containing protein [Actinoplanes sp. NPDC049118]|uniref:thioredoxin family protein n=1 Tax=Actinoplanes sp. NPDC049118 TaxID=3155769 RepID=UPI003402A518
MPEDSLTAVTDETFAELVLGNRLPVVVDFWAEWCPPCGPLAKTLAGLAGEFTGKLVIATLNMDENPVTGRAYRVMSLPTLMFFQRGVVVHTIVGSRPRSQLRQALAGSFEAYANR